MTPTPVSTACVTHKVMDSPVSAILAMKEHCAKTVNLIIVHYMKLVLHENMYVI